MLDGVRDGVVHRQPKPGRQADDDDRRRGHQRHIQVGIDPHGVVGGPVEQLGDVDRNVVVGGGQLALREPLERSQRGLDARLGADDVVDDFFALLVGQIEGGQHLEVGAHRGQRGAQFVRRHRGEVARRRQRGVGAVLFLPDALQHALDRVGDLDGLGGTANLDIGCLVAGVDLAGLLRQPFERPHRERGQQPTEQGRRADGEDADHQHAAMQVIRIADGGVVGGADRHRHRFGHADVHRAHPVAHAVDVGVGVTGRQLRQHDGRVGRHLTLLADGDHRVLVVGRSRNLVEAARQERNREAGRLVEAAVQSLLAVVGDADPHDGADDDDDDRRADRGGECDAGAQRRGAGEDPRQPVHQVPLFLAQALITASGARTPRRARCAAAAAHRRPPACGAGSR